MFRVDKSLAVTADRLKDFEVMYLTEMFTLRSWFKDFQYAYPETVITTGSKMFWSMFLLFESELFLVVTTVTGLFLRG